MDKKKSLKKIKSSVMSRSLSLAKFSVSTGARWAGQAIGGVLKTPEAQQKAFDDFLLSQAEFLTRELGQLKGSMMKAGQLLSTYGEHFLPDEINSVLKSLQSQSPPLQWPAIEAILRNELGEEKLSELNIDPVSVASASLGQVHKAILKDTNQVLAIKIQYPGVGRAIENDIRVLKSLFTVSKLVPQLDNLDPLLAEISQMLHQELDYFTEMEFTNEVRGLLKNDLRYKVPRIFADYSTMCVISSEYMNGLRFDSETVVNWPQERRNELGLAFLELYFKELLLWGIVQTDPHFGNYQILPREQTGLSHDVLVLLDFGAVRKLGLEFARNYRELVRGAVLNDQTIIENAGFGLGFLRPDDPQEVKQYFLDFCQLMGEPFHGEFDWAQSDLPKRVLQQGKLMVQGLRFRAAPRELVFLDRKLGGVYTVLSKLGVKAHGRELLLSYLKDSEFAPAISPHIKGSKHE